MREPVKDNDTLSEIPRVDRVTETSAQGATSIAKQGSRIAFFDQVFDGEALVRFFLAETDDDGNETVALLGEEDRLHMATGKELANRLRSDSRFQEIQLIPLEL